MKNRQIELMKILLGENKIYTAKHLSELLNISSKTIRNDVCYCDEYLRSFDVKICKKSGIGIWVKASEQNKLKVIDSLKKLKRDLVGSEATGREIFVLKELLFAKYKITVTHLKDNLFICDTLLYKDIEAASLWLKERKIIVSKDKQGAYCIVGEEKRIRRAMSDWRLFYIQMYGPVNTKEMLSSTIGENRYEIEYGKSIIKNISSIIHLKLSPDDFDGLVFRLLITVHRIRNGCKITIISDAEIELKKLMGPRYLIALDELVARYFNMKLLEPEMLHLLTTIDSMNVPEKRKQQIYEKNYANEIKYFENRVIEIVKKRIRFSNEAYYFIQISKKVVSIINRIQFGFFSYYPYADSNYYNSDILGLVVDEIETLFEDELSYKLTLSDKSEWVAFLSLLIEKAKVPLNIIYLFSHNFLDAELSVKVLTNNMNQIIVRKVIPYYEHCEELEKDIDLIIIDSSDIQISTQLVTIIILPNLSLEEKRIAVDKISSHYERINYRRLSRNQSEL